MKKLIIFLLTCVFASSAFVGQCTAKTIKNTTNPATKQKRMKTQKETKTCTIYDKTKKPCKKSTPTGGAAKTRDRKKIHQQYYN